MGNLQSYTNVTRIPAVIGLFQPLPFIRSFEMNHRDKSPAFSLQLNWVKQGGEVGQRK